MKKKVLILTLLSIFLVGCSNDDKTESSSSTTEESTSSSSKSNIKSPGNLTPERRKNTFSSSSESSSSSVDNSTNSVEVTSEQKQLLVTFIQQDLKDNGYEYKYQGYDVWDVVTNDTTEYKRYIVTTEDSKLGRIKAIYEWDGNAKSEQYYNNELLYLLVGGEELVNKL